MFPNIKVPGFTPERVVIMSAPVVDDFPSCQVLSDVCPPDVITKFMVPVVSNLANDTVPNVRFNVAKTMAKIAPVLDSA